MKCSMLLFVSFLSVAVADAGEIRGRVLDARGEAVVGARVTVDNIVRRQLRQENRQEVTGPDGTYTITGLEAGRYIVRAIGPSRRISVRQVVVVRSASNRLQVDFQLQAEPAPTSGP